MSPFQSIPFNDEQFVKNLYSTFDKFLQGHRDFFEREFNNFKEDNIIFGLSTEQVLGAMGSKNDMLKASWVSEINRLYTKKDIDAIMRMSYENKELLLEVGKYLRRYAIRSNFEIYKYYDVLRSYS